MKLKRHKRSSPYRNIDTNITPFNAVMISDLHLTEHKIDAYRWKIWEQVVDIKKEYGCHDLFILGDIWVWRKGVLEWE